jgi:hypothetical protein
MQNKQTNEASLSPLPHLAPPLKWDRHHSSPILLLHLHQTNLGSVFRLWWSVVSAPVCCACAVPWPWHGTASASPSVSRGAASNIAGATINTHSFHRLLRQRSSWLVASSYGYLHIEKDYINLPELD